MRGTELEIFSLFHGFPNACKAPFDRTAGDDPRAWSYRWPYGVEANRMHLHQILFSGGRFPGRTTLSSTVCTMGLSFMESPFNATLA